MVLVCALALQLAVKPQADPEVEGLIDEFAASPGAKIVDARAFQYAVYTFSPVRPMTGRNPSTGVSQVDNALEGLERLGLRALPDLLEHLTDPRKTVFQARGLRGAIALFFGYEYDPRLHDPARQPLGVSTDRDSEHPTSVPGQQYTLCVGDLCYGVVGQIVNRKLAPIGLAPEAAEVINSTVQAPSLAGATRSDWAGRRP